MSGQLPSITSPPWGATTKRIVVLVVVVLLLLIVGRIGGSAWTAIIVAMLLAYLLSPVVLFFERRLKRVIPLEDVRRTLAVLLTWLLVIGTLGVIIGLIVPATVSQLRAFADRLPELIDETENDLRDTLSQPIPLGDMVLVPWDELESLFGTQDETDGGNGISGALSDAALTLADPALNVLGGALEFLFSTIFMLTMLFYLMRDGPRFADYLVGVVPESYQGDARRLLFELGRIWNAYLRGQITLSVIMAVVMYVVALVLGLPQPLVLGLLSGFLEFIPTFGPAIAQVPALLFALTTDSSTIPALDAGLLYAVVVSVTYMTMQQLEALFIVPRVLGSSLDLHPFVVLVSVLVGASLAGVLGVVLAAPTVATLRLFGRYLRAKLLDEELFAEATWSKARPGSFIYWLIRHLLDRRLPVFPPPDDSLPRLSAGHATPPTSSSSAVVRATPAHGAGTSGERTERPDISEWAL